MWCWNKVIKTKNVIELYLWTFTFALIPGIIFPVRLLGKFIVIFIGILCTTLTKLPEAFCGGIRLKEEAEAGEKDNTFPSNLIHF